MFIGRKTELKQLNEHITQINLNSLLSMEDEELEKHL